jgi:hypothetical protein
LARRNEMKIRQILRHKRRIVAVTALVVCAMLALLAMLCPHSRLNPFRREFNPTDWTKSSDVPSDTLRIRIVDEQGVPVDGAFVGEILEGNFSSTYRDGEFPETLLKAQRIDLANGEYSLLSFINGASPPRSSPDGIVDIPKELLGISHPKWHVGRSHVLYVVHPERRIGGLVCCRARDLGSVAEITLRQLCQVRGTVARADGNPLYVAQTYAFWGPLRPWRLMPASQGGRPPEVNMLLPPGSYTLLTAYSERDEAGVTWLVKDTKKVVLRKDTETPQVSMLLRRSKRPAKMAGEQKTNKALDATSQ